MWQYGSGCVNPIPFRKQQNSLSPELFPVHQSTWLEGPIGILGPLRNPKGKSRYGLSQTIHRWLYSLKASSSPSPVQHGGQWIHGIEETATLRAAISQPMTQPSQRWRMKCS